MEAGRGAGLFWLSGAVGSKARARKDAKGQRSQSWTVDCRLRENSSVLRRRQVSGEDDRYFLEARIQDAGSLVETLNLSLQIGHLSWAISDGCWLKADGFCCHRSAKSHPWCACSFSRELIIDVQKSRRVLQIYGAGGLGKVGTGHWSLQIRHLVIWKARRENRTLGAHRSARRVSFVFICIVSLVADWWAGFHNDFWPGGYSRSEDTEGAEMPRRGKRGRERDGTAKVDFRTIAEVCDPGSDQPSPASQRPATD